MMACPYGGYGGYGMPPPPGPPGGPAPGGATADSVVGLLSPYQVERIKRNVQLLGVVDLGSVKERAGATDAGVDDYKKFLALRAMVTEMTSNDVLMTSPTSNMDALWHEHVLDTREYYACCEMLLGSSHRGIIHHDPKVIKDLTAKSARRRALKELWYQVFDEPPNEGWDVDPLDVDDYRKRIVGRKRRRETSATFEIFVKTMTGKCETLRMDPDAEVEDLKLAIYNAIDVPVDQQRIVFAGKQLKDGETLGSCGIEEHSTVLLVLRLAGC